MIIVGYYHSYYHQYLFSNKLFIQVCNYLFYMLVSWFLVAHTCFVYDTINVLTNYKQRLLIQILIFCLFRPGKTTSHSKQTRYRQLRDKNLHINAFSRDYLENTYLQPYHVTKCSQCIRIRLNTKIYKIYINSN